MADRMFEDVVRPPVPVGGTSAYLPLSIGVHAALIAFAVVLPLVAPGALPVPATILAFVVPPAPPLPPVPALTSVQPASRSADSSAPPLAPHSAPFEAPAGIGPGHSPTTAADLAGLGIIEQSGCGCTPGGAVVGPPSDLPTFAAPSVPIRAGGDVKPPRKTKDVRPTYPEIARAGKVEGVVIIEATIGPDGRVQNARALRSNPLLEAAAIDAVRQWEFTPTLLNGMPVAVIMSVTVDFRLR